MKVFDLLFILLAALGMCAVGVIAVEDLDDVIAADYKMTLFSRHEYEGRAVIATPNKCTNLAEFDIRSPRSIHFVGNNVCMFFPDDDTTCRHMEHAQPVMGDVENTDAWGFTNGIGAIKCLSQHAADIFKNSECEFDPTCGAADKQGNCPYDRTCTQYRPDPMDWQGFGGGGDPVKERYHVLHDGRVINKEAEAPKPYEKGRFETEGRNNWEGGSDDYSKAWEPDRPEPDGHRDRKEMERQERKLKEEIEKQAKKDARRREKEEKAFRKAQEEKFEKERKDKKKQSKAKNVAAERLKNGQ